MCEIFYTLYSCGHWVPQPSQGNGPFVRLCPEAESHRLGQACPETQLKHIVKNRSLGMCDQCLWIKVTI
ncbi:hypothetical protein DM02DRAFT_54536 [Periconia macrospinosa]|uniref:Uncharacterized protein n=1 Tax=Periconia macrospinosa TaxID=97972 RepID=A0A2V1E5T6_9PLEO|nr:hypothetical protein DM02DRAFT_54536 [Periconia macrospinosa]